MNSMSPNSLCTASPFTNKVNWTFSRWLPLNRPPRSVSGTIRSICLGKVGYHLGSGAILRSLDLPYTVRPRKAALMSPARGCAAVSL